MRIKKGDKQDITAKHEELTQTITPTELAAMIEQFDTDDEDSPPLKFTRRYMAMVVCEVLLSARHVNYARIIPEYLRWKW